MLSCSLTALAQSFLSYDFMGDFSEDGGGVALSSTDPGAFVANSSCPGSPLVWSFSNGPELLFDNALAGGFLSPTYTLEMILRIDAAPIAWAKVFDFGALAIADQGTWWTSDAGLQGISLFTTTHNFSSPGSFPLGTYKHLVLRRDTSGVLTLWIDGVQEVSAPDPTGTHVLSAANKLYLLTDDSVGPGGPIENGAGFISFLRLYDVALTDPQALALAPADICTPEPPPFGTPVSAHSRVGQMVLVLLFLSTFWLLAQRRRQRLKR